jgi:FkbM family methyltransferase
MPILSFAQNLEDVILYRALSEVENGFFIDVGAGDPHRENVSRAFKDFGWNGINIEPVDDVYQALAAERPDDINIYGGLANTSGDREFFVVESDTRLSTFSPQIAQKHRREGRVVTSKRVPFFTLEEICAKHVTGPIHFLKIDVEGGEREVLEGADFKKYRPWIIVLEATLPLSPIESYGTWEEIIFGADYEFVYTDRLNRFYVSKEKYDDLRNHFIYPPNVYDQYRLAEVVILRHELGQLEITLESNSRELTELQSAHTAELDRQHKQILDVQFERDVSQQEMFETERHSQWLSMERQRLLDVVAQHRGHLSPSEVEASLAARLEADRADQDRLWEARLHAEKAEQGRSWEARLHAEKAEQGRIWEARLKVEKEATLSAMRELEADRAEQDWVWQARLHTEKEATNRALEMERAEQGRLWEARLHAEKEAIAAAVRKDFFGSLSWRLTKPVRALKRLTQRTGA